MSEKTSEQLKEEILARFDKIIDDWYYRSVERLLVCVAIAVYLGVALIVLLFI